MNNKIKLIKSNIVDLDVDVIINAANNSLLGGGGVDGAIHRAAGIKLLEECRTLKGCATGNAKITRGYNLKAKYVIHTVGPVWGGGNENEDLLLKNCYLNSLKLCVENKIGTVAFPSISTGVYGFPIIRASKIALNTISEFLKTDYSISEVIICCFSKSDLEVYEANRKELDL